MVASRKGPQRLKIVAVVVSGLILPPVFRGHEKGSQKSTRAAATAAAATAEAAATATATATAANSRLGGILPLVLHPNANAFHVNEKKSCRTAATARERRGD